MLTSLTHGPLLWFLNRGTGIVVLLALTLSLCLGILSAGRRSGGRLPAFVPQYLHRNLSVLALALTAVHAATAVLDTYVDIRWWQAFSPWGGSYRPFWLGLGAIAFDIMLVVAATSWAHARLSHRAWHRIHLLGYATWPIALAHGAGIGTDAGLSWTRLLATGCAVAVLLSATIRLRRRAALRRPVLARVTR